MKQTRIFLFLLISICTYGSLTISCSDEIDPEKDLIAADPDYTPKVVLRDNYMNNYYYWYKDVNSRNAGYKPYEFEDIYAWFQALLYKPTDRWSWMEDADSYLQTATGQITGTWGIGTGQAIDYYNDYGIFVKYIYPDSPLTKYGVTRGAQLRGIAGVDLGDQIDSAEKLAAYNNHFYDSPNTFTFRLTDGRDTTFTISLPSSVKTDFILKTAIFRPEDFPGLTEPVGYFHLLQFEGNFASAMDAPMAGFKAAGVKKLIVDLRYNGGGELKATEHLISYLAPKGLVGKPFCIITHNDKKSSNNQTHVIGENGKDISIGLEEIYFIMDKGSASASEVVFNGLRPYLKEKLHHVGKQTYGKPNGMYVFYYPSETDHPEYYNGNFSALKYVFLPICFFNKNSAGEDIPSGSTSGTGFIPENDRPDDIFHNFGVNEDRIRACLYHIVNGTYPDVDDSHVRRSTKTGYGMIVKSLLPEEETDPHYGKCTVLAQ